MRSAQRDEWSPAQRRRIDELVLAAAGLDADERRGLLAADPAEDPRVLAEVERRLAAADALPDDYLDSPLSAFLDHLDLDPPEAADGDASPGAPASVEMSSEERYALGEVLGRGGMGEVYAAEDRLLGRSVALKLLSSDDPRTRDSFLSEARAQARVQHEHVLDIFDTGLLNGRPYIAMPRVDGGGLDEVATSFDLERKVRLVAQAAEGLHAAHRRGLLHRDVKPSNILVGRSADGDYRAWVSDFGIATEVDLETGRGDLFGTPHFMAPERLDGGTVDRRSDVFSLGVTLYALLSGAFPFDGDGPLSILREVREAEPVPLRSRIPGLPADLEAIVHACLAKDPDARYSSARALADDLYRYLDGDVVEAYTAGLAYRLTRFARRHRGWLTVAGLLAVGLVVALAVAAVLGLQAMHARAVSEKRQAQAEGLVSFMLGDLRDRLEPLGRLDLLDEVGDRALAYFAEVPESELSEDELARRSQALYQVGHVRILQGKMDAAVPALRESLELAERLAERRPGDLERLFGLGQSRFWVAYALWEAGDVDGAEPYFEAYLDLSERLVDAAPKRADYRLELSYAHTNLGFVHQSRGDFEAALERFQAAFEIVDGPLRELLGDTPDRLREAAAAHNTLGLVLRSLGRLDAAREHVRSELALRRELVRLDPEDTSAESFLATALLYAAELDLVQGRPRQAEEPVVAASRILDKLTAHDPENGEWTYKRVLARLREGRLAFALGDVETAREHFRASVARAEALVARDESRVEWRRALGTAALHLAATYLGGGHLGSIPGTGTVDPRLAGPSLDQAVQVFTRLAEERPKDREAHRRLAETRLLQAEAAAAEGQNTEAEAFRESAAAGLTPWVEGSSDHRLLVPWCRALEALGRSSEAERVRARLESAGVSIPAAVPTADPG